VGMIAIGFVGFCLNRLLVLVERYLLRWKNDEAGEGRVAGLD